MQNIKKTVALLLFTIAVLIQANAQIKTRRITSSSAIQEVKGNAAVTDSVPSKVFVKTAVSPNLQLKEEEKAKGMQQRADKVQVVQPVQNLQPEQKNPQREPVLPVVKKDAVFIKKLNETFKPAANTTVAEKIKIKFIIDSVYIHSKENPKIVNGDTTLDYLALVRIIDSLLKVNKNDSPKVVIDSTLIKKYDSAINVINESKRGLGRNTKNYWWLFIIGLFVIAGVAFLLFKRKRNNAIQSKIFFSYAWDQDEALIMQLYNSLKNAGFNVVKDKENMGYKGVISKFMNEIGIADFVIVAISDKYLKSKFCMYELYEIFKNSGMNRDVFGKKLFPIRIEESLDLGNPDTVNEYVKYWKEQEQEWTKRVKEESDSITEEQARQFQFIKRLVIDIRNILSCLSDINSLNLNTLKSNDFADVKAALKQSIDMKQP
jgi:LPXTG-motif cell wall-anchored protein